MSTTRLTAAIEFGGMAATRSASFRPSASRSAAGTRRSSQPMSSASAASTSRPLRMISSARPRPTMRGQRLVPPAPGRMPMGTSGCPMTARGDPRRRSSAEANSHPPPRAAPSSSPMVSSRPDERRSKVAAATLGSVCGAYCPVGIGSIASTSPCIRKKSGSALRKSRTWTSGSGSTRASSLIRAPMKPPSTRLVGGWSIVTVTRPGLPALTAVVRTISAGERSGADCRTGVGSLIVLYSR